MGEFRVIIKKIIGRRKAKVRKEKMHNIQIDSMYISRERELSVMIIKTINKPGILEKITDIIASRNINIVKIDTPEILEGEEAFLTLLLDCSIDVANEIAKNIRDEMKDLVYQIDVKGARDSYIFTPFNTLVFGDRRACVLTKGMIREILRGIHQERKARIYCQQILRSIGRAIGRQLYKGWIEYLEYEKRDSSWEEFVENALEHFADFYHALGFGWIVIERLSNNKYRIIIYNNIECDAARELGFHGKTGILTAGIIAGYLETLTSRRAVVEETSCINTGSDHDVFEIELLETIRRKEEAITT